MQPPQISIIIPIYKVEKYIERCTLSIINQTIREQIEVIFVNDHTPDKSIDILNSTLKNNPPKSNITIQILHHKENRGQAIARLTALNHARGSYILCIDSDDFIDHDMVEKMYLKAKDTNADIVMVDVYKEFENHKLIIKSPYSINKEDILSAFIRGTAIYLCNKLIKKNLFLDFSSYFKEGYNMSEDYTIMIPIAFAAKTIEYVPNTFYHYVQYNTNATTKKGISDKEIKGWLYSVECLENYLRKNNIKKYGKDVLHRKLIIRYWCMLNTSGKKQIEYSKLYPEINVHKKEILNYIDGITSKIFYSIIINGNTIMFNSYIKLKKLLKHGNYSKN